MKKNILVLGGAGMLGQMIAQYLLKKQYKVDVLISQNKHLSYTPNEIIIKNLQKNCNINFNQYDYVVNCVGAIKQKQYTPSEFYYLNAFLPKLLSNLCNKHNTRLIHYSSDCIFSGLKDYPYEKLEACDATDDYGISKFLGEIDNQIVFRTSIIGPANDNFGLFEWFKSQKEIVNGFTNHYWSGLTTLELAKQTENAISQDIENDLYQLSSTFINKHDLLCKINEVFKFKKTIIPIESSKLNRCLISDYKICSIGEQLQELKEYSND